MYDAVGEDYVKIQRDSISFSSHLTKYVRWRLAKIIYFFILINILYFINELHYTSFLFI